MEGTVVATQERNGEDMTESHGNDIVKSDWSEVWGLLLGCGRAEHWKWSKLENVWKLSPCFANTEVEELLDIYMEIYRYRLGIWSSADKNRLFLAVTLAAWLWTYNITLDTLDFSLVKNINYYMGPINGFWGLNKTQFLSNIFGCDVK